MRVLMTIDSVGGVWDLSLALARGLQLRGHEVILAHVGPSPRPDHRKEADRAGVRIVTGSFPLEWMARGLELAPACRRWLGSLAKQVGADLVHCNSYSHVDGDSRTPQVLVAHSSLHGWWEATHPGQDAPGAWNMYRGMVRQALGNADAVVAPSQAMLDELVRCYRDVGGKVIHNGLPVPLGREGARKDMVLTGGRLWDEGKGHKALDAAARDLPWPVAASGSLSGPHGDVAFQHLQILGFLSRSSLESAYRSAAVYANPALYEPFGLGGLEAAAHGCALVLSDIPSQREIWADAALYARPGDASNWHEVLSRLVRDAPLRKQMGEAANQRALLFDASTMARHYEQLYQQIQVVAA